MYGTIIIHEIHFPNEQKYLKPEKIEGAGGEKYRVNQILFKLVTEKLNDVYG